jgi:hypothetical protein
VRIPHSAIEIGTIINKQLTGLICGISQLTLVSFFFGFS